MLSLRRTSRVRGLLIGQTWVLIILTGLTFLGIGLLDYIYRFWFLDGGGAIVLSIIGVLILLLSMMPRLLAVMTPLGAWSLGIIIVTAICIAIVVVADVISLGGILNG